jgi:two-component system alkaline phosphatase synthesis response regulator PhoP
MATAKGSEYDKVLGLDLGADDYLAKPFGMMEMISRTKAVLRRAESFKGSKVLSLGKIQMDDAAHKVTFDGKKVDLTLKEYDLLRTLMENPGVVFTRDTLLSTVWGIEYSGETRTVDVHVGSLRSKLGAGGDYIKTVRGVGYRLEVKE